MAQFNKDYFIIQKSEPQPAPVGNKIALWVDTNSDKTKITFSDKPTETFAYESFVELVSSNIVTSIDDLNVDLQTQIVDLSAAIAAIVQESTVIESSGSTIIFSKTGYEYNLEVADYISKTEVESIEFNLQQQISSLTAASSGGFGEINGLLSTTSSTLDIVSDGSLEITPSITSNELEIKLSDAVKQQISDLDTRLETLENISGGYVTSVNNISGGVFLVGTDGIEIDNSGNTITISVSGDFATNTDLDDYTLLSTTESISSNLQSQINDIEQESTVIESSGGSILVSQDGAAWNLEVASAPIQDHNDLNGLQGGDTGEYYHLTQSQFNDYIGSTEVAGLTGNLQSQINDIDVSGFITTSEVESISSGLDSRITIIENDYVVGSDLDNYTLLSTTESISSNLQTQINAIEEEQTVIVGGDGIEVVEDPTHTWTISVSGDFANNIEVETITTSAGISEFDKVYSLQGSANYTVTLPTALGNENKIARFYKHETVANQHTVTLQTDGSDVINAPFNKVTTLNFRFGGEYLALISDGTKWNVLGESGLFNKKVVVRGENEFLLGISKLNDLLGGEVLVESAIELTDIREINTSGIKIRGSGTANSRIDFSNINNHLLISGDCNFESLRFRGFAGVQANPDENHNIIKFIRQQPVNIRFENCTFQNVVGNNPASTGCITFEGSGQLGANLLFSNCDFFPNRDGQFEIYVDPTSVGFFNVHIVSNLRSQRTYRMKTSDGSPIGQFRTDGSALIVGDYEKIEPVLAAGLVDYQSSTGTAYNNDKILILSETLNSLRKINAGDFIESLKLGESGKIFLNTQDYEYDVISPKVTPFSSIQLGVETPSASSSTLIANTTELDSGKFKIITSGSPPENGYVVHWHATPSDINLNPPEPTATYIISGDPNIEEQTIAGYGANIAYSTQNISEDEYLKELFFGDTNEESLGLQIVRARINNRNAPVSNESDGWNYVNNIMTTTQQPESWEWRTAKAAGDEYGVKTILTMWSAPGYMKTGGSGTWNHQGGSVKTGINSDGSGQPFYYELAVFQCKVIAQYLNQGIDLCGFEPINEPNGSPINESTFFTDSELLDYIENYLKPQMEEFEIDHVKIMTPTTIDWQGGDGAASAYSNTIASSGVDIIAAHQYDWSYDLFDGTPNWTTLNPIATNKPVWQTEISDAFNNSMYPINTIQHALWFSRNIHRAMDNNVIGWLFWWIRSTQPESASFLNNEALVSDQSSNPTVSKTAYGISQWAKFIKSGFIRIESTKNGPSNPTSVFESGVHVNGFKNGSNRYFVVTNDTGTIQDYLIDCGDLNDYVVTPYVTDSTRNSQQLQSLVAFNGKFQYDLPLYSIITFVMEVV